MPGSGSVSAVVIESEPNDSAATATFVAPPETEFEGFVDGTDVDYFRFDLAPGSDFAVQFSLDELSFFDTLWFDARDSLDNELFAGIDLALDG